MESQVTGAKTGHYLTWTQYNMTYAACIVVHYQAYNRAHLCYRPITLFHQSALYSYCPLLLYDNCPHCNEQIGTGIIEYEDEDNVRSSYRQMQGNHYDLQVTFIPSF